MKIYEGKNALAEVVTEKISGVYSRYSFLEKGNGNSLKQKGYEEGKTDYNKDSF